MKQTNTKISFITFAALLFAVLGFTTMANASTSPFAQNDTDTISVATKGGDKKAEKKCGEGKCGDKKAEKKCGEGKCGDKKAEKKCGEGKCGDKKAEKKCGEGKCGDKKAEKKCGEGKCGG